MHVGLQHYLFVSAALASLGVIAMVSRRNAVSILMGIELILNAAAINFVAFSRYGKAAPESPALSGQVFSIFVIALAAAEAAIALAIIIAIYHARSHIDADRLRELRQ
jgi:NADH-quinone oxidoreductase subunit K